MQRYKAANKTQESDRAPGCDNFKEEQPNTLVPKSADASRCVDDKAETPVFLTEKQLAARHQKSVKTIRNLRVKGGYIPYVKIGRHVRYRLQDVLAYENANRKRFTSDDGGDNA